MITKHFTKVQKHKGETSIFEVMNDMLILFFFFSVLGKYLFNCPVTTKKPMWFSFREKSKTVSMHFLLTGKFAYYR